MLLFITRPWWIGSTYLNIAPSVSNPSSVLSAVMASFGILLALHLLNLPVHP